MNLLQIDGIELFRNTCFVEHNETCINVLCAGLRHTCGLREDSWCIEQGKTPESIWILQNLLSAYLISTTLYKRRNKKNSGICPRKTSAVGRYFTSIQLRPSLNEVPLYLASSLMAGIHRGSAHHKYKFDPLLSSILSREAGI